MHSPLSLVGKRDRLPLPLVRFVHALLATAIAMTASAQAAPKALFVLVDGIPADVLERTPTPAIDEIAGAGGYTRAFVGGEAGGPSESPTVSAVGYNSMLTGTWANKHGVYDNAIETPNYDAWDIFRVARFNNPEVHTALFSTWEDNRTRLLGDGLPEAGGAKLSYHFDGFEHDTTRFPHDEESEYIKAIDALVTEAAARYVVEAGPDLAWVYLQHTDDIGHQFGDGEQMAAAVSLMDANVGKLWQAVQARARSSGEDWLLLVTTDHGRDRGTGKSHGGQTERERTIWIATNSRRLNERFTRLPGIVDIMPSLAAHLGLEIPDAIAGQLDGQSFID